ncbi:MAG TPA: hypothetical protein VLV32_02275 [Burkholderiales bacterium]|nr:hypothetical protein [Burkholderiales bacterium]
MVRTVRLAGGHRQHPYVYDEYWDVFSVNRLVTAPPVLLEKRDVRLTVDTSCGK